MRTGIPLLFGLLLLVSPSAHAEGYFSLYGGGAFTQDDDNGFAVPGFATGNETQFEESGVVGGRLGFWGDGDWNFLGGAFDVSWFGPDGEKRSRPAEFDVVPLSFLLMARAPLLTSDAHPNGQLQPYFGVGPSLVVSTLEIPLPGRDFDDTEVDAGVDLRTGLSVIPVDPLGLFVEYRFTHFEPDYEDSVGVLVNTRARASTELSTHFVQAGLSFRF